MNTTSAAVKPPIPIDEVILHVDAHVDEDEAYRRVRAYGERLLPGCSKAQVRFTLGMPARPDAAFDAERKLPIGCAQTRFDEHKADGERLPGECATTLVSTYLELTHDPILTRMADEVLRCDTQRGVKLTELPELTKMFHRRLKNGDEYILRWTVKALNAIQHQLYYAYAPVPGEKTLLKIFEDLKKHFPNEKAREKLKKFLEESAARKDQLIFELAFIVECLFRTKLIKPEEVFDWVRFPLDHLYADQLEFLKCVTLCKKLRKEHNKGWYDITALCKGREQKLKLFFCQADSAIMQRAARYCGADIVILRNSKMQVMVCIDSDVRGLNLVNFARMIRWLELADKTAATWYELGCEGVHPLVPQWYFFRQAGQLLNGSLTHPNTPRTLISSEAILEVTRYAFHHEDGVREWRRKHRVRMRWTSRKRGSKEGVVSRKEQPAPEVKPVADQKVSEPATGASAPEAKTEAPEAKAAKKPRKLRRKVSLDEAEVALLEEEQPAS